MILVAGEALIDLVEIDGGTYRAVVGGSPANVAVGTARLGVPTRFLARLSGDAFGQRIRTHLAANSVDLSHAVHAAEPTSIAVASLDEAGHAEYAFYLNGTADWQWSADEVPALDREVVAVHTGSLALAVPPGADVLEGLVRDARVTSSIDLNLRPSIRGDRQAEQRRVERQIHYADIVKASDEDLAWLYPDRPFEQVAAVWRAAGVGCGVVTMGAAGCYVLPPDGAAIRQPPIPTTVVDTVGAGDSFTAGLLAALNARRALGDRPHERLAALDYPAWSAVIEYATRAASITCGRRGADPPTEAEMSAP